MTQTAGSDIVSLLIDGLPAACVTSSSLPELLPLLPPADDSELLSGVDEGDTLAITQAEVSDEADLRFLAVVRGARADTRAHASNDPLILHVCKNLQNV